MTKLEKKIEKERNVFYHKTKNEKKTHIDTYWEEGKLIISSFINQLIRLLAKAAKEAKK